MDDGGRSVKPGSARRRPAPLRRWVAMAGVAVALAAAAGVGAPATPRLQTSGDEPHYLLTAEALGRHGTLDVARPYSDERYRTYHDGSLSSQAASRPDGRLVVPHDPLLPAVLAVPMRLGGWVAAKATLALLAGALAALVTWTASVRFAVPPPTAGAVALVLGAAPPLASYGSQVYPEIPAALAAAVGVAALTGPLRRSGVVALAAAVVALPWLGVKYAPVAAALAGVGLVRLWRRGRARQALLLALALGVAGLAYAAAHLAWYGGLTVYAAGSFFQAHGGELSVLGTRPNYLGRSTRLVGLLVDAEFGLAAWQPAWLLAVPALAAAAGAVRAGWGRRPGRADGGGAAGRVDLPAAAAPLAAGWLGATFLAATMHGWWFAGRQVVVVLPLAALVLAWWVGAQRRRLLAFLALGASGVLAHGWLVAEGWAGRLGWVVGFSDTTNPAYQLLARALPSYRAPDPATWWLHAGWLVVLVALAAWGWRLGAPPGARAGAPGG